MCHGETESDILPIILLGLRTYFKNDLGTFVAELGFGTMLKVPGEFFLLKKCRATHEFSLRISA